MTGTTLRILQYNVNHGKDATLVPLLHDTSVNEFDILAIQEPWRNPLVTTGYNPSGSQFYLAYPPKELTRVCFYINKKIHLNSWTVKHHNEDAQTVTLNYERDKQEEKIQIHNIYNPSPTSYSSREPGTLEILRSCVEEVSTEHIVVGDFNLHHPLWNGLSRPTQHAAADTLLDITCEASLELVTRSGMITWQARGTHSTIDLAFISRSLTNRLLKCTPRPDIAQSSDHTPIEVTLDLQLYPAVTSRKRCWKQLDSEKLLEFLEQATLSDSELISRLQIDTHVHELTKILTASIEKCIPWQKPSQFAKSYWSPECTEAVHETRERYYDMLQDPTPETEELHRCARLRKVTTIRNAKRQEFREFIASTADSTQDVYRLAKWARQKAGRPKDLPQLPELIVKRQNESQEIVTHTLTTLPEKLEALRTKFFPKIKEANLADIDEELHPIPHTIKEEITVKDIQSALRRLANDKAPGPDQIPNRVLKAAEAWLTPHLYKLYNATVRIGYHPKAWKEATTLALRKPNKEDYTLVGAYRPIALLNTLGKLLELVMSRKLSSLAESKSLLSKTQMGARKGRSTESALQLLTEQVHTIWNLPGKQRVATMLCMDMAGAFGNVSHTRLLDNLRMKGIPNFILRWVTSFLEERTTKIKAIEGESKLFSTETGIPQGSPISPILFLFFISDLLDTTNNEGLRTSSIGFVDDVHILTYGDSTERNCAVLSRIHRQCERWADRHGAQFAPEKYELIHFAKRPKLFNMAAPLQIGQIRKVATDNVRVLGVQVDTRLKWGPHIAKIIQKHTAQSYAIDRIAASTWGTSFKMAKLVYTSVIRPVITYGATAWYIPQGVATARKMIDKKLEVLQNKNLRRILGAYRAVGSRILEKEAGIAPISTILTANVANATRRRLTGGAANVIRDACTTIRNRTIRSARHRRHPETTKPSPGELTSSWLQTIIPTATWQSTILQQSTPSYERPLPWKGIIQNHAKSCWDKLWTAYLATIPPGRTRSPAQSATTSYDPQIHFKLSKATTSLVTQIRTEKIGLNAFLAGRHVPDKTAPCPCGWARQDAKHILLFCPDFAEGREEFLTAAGTQDYSKLIATARGAKAAARRMQQTGLLPQFSLGL